MVPVLRTFTTRGRLEKPSSRCREDWVLCAVISAVSRGGAAEEVGDISNQRFQESFHGEGGL